MQIISYPDIPSFEESNLLFSSVFLSPYFESFAAFESKGILQWNEKSFVPYQILKIDLSKTFQKNNLLQGNKKWFYQWLMQCGKSETDAMDFKVIVLGNIIITGPEGFGSVADVQIDFKKVSKELLKKFTDCDAVFMKDLPTAHLNASKNEIWVKMFPQMQLELRPEWFRFDDYLQALSSKYRIRVKSALRAIQGLEMKDLDHDALWQYKDQLYDLYLNVFNKAGFKIAQLDANALIRMKEKLGKQLIIRCIFKDHQPVAFSALLLDGTSAYAIMVGLDYALNEQHKLYFNLLIDLIYSSIKFQAKTLNLGRTAMEIKSTLGAVPHDTYSLVKFKSIANQLMFKQLINRLKQPEWIQRRPFKVEQKALTDAISI